jgi:prepilin-type processing-associated H-X9-DG protein
MLDEPHADNQRPAVVKSVHPIEGGADVTFADGHVERHGFVIGADGVRSTVRSSLFPGQQSRPAIVSTAAFRIMAANPGDASYTIWSGAGSAFLLIPVDNDEVYAFASATGGRHVAADPEWLSQTFANYPDAVKAVVVYSPIEDLCINQWTRGRVALIGDAAHATAPVWAQGTALAAEDALTLADVLAGGDWDAAGVRYQERRRERVRHVQEVTDPFSQALALPQEIRDLRMPVAGPKAYHQAFGPLRQRGCDQS